MKLLALLGFLILLAGSLWFVSRPHGAPFDPSNDAPPETEAPAAGLEAAAEPTDSPLSASGIPPSPPREMAPSTPTEAGDPTGARCRILGRIVDESGTALPGISIVAYSVGEAWADGVVLPEVTLRGRTTQALLAVTDADGRFVLEATPPTSDWVHLSVDPDDFHGLLARDFGPAGGRDQPRLVAGGNDLGDLVLATTGAIEGSVRAVDGAPIPGAAVSLHGVFPGGLGVRTRADDDGSFLLGHVPPGIWSIRAEANGRLSATSESIEVSQRQVARGAEFTLLHAPSISGVVVDESGDPVPAVFIQAWPRSSGQGAFTKTLPDGSFTLHLPQDEPYRLDIEHEGYQPYGGFQSDSIEPGTVALRVVLQRGDSILFLVLDEESGEPIERYGIEVQQLASGGWDRSEDPRSPKTSEHAEGIAKLPVLSGKCVVHVEAPGYASAGPDLAADATTTGRMTIRMARGSEVSGRALRAGVAIAGVEVLLERCFVKIDASLPDEPEDDRWFSENYRFDLSPFVGRQRDTATGTDGRFRFASVPAGTYSVTLRDRQSAPLVLESVKVGAKGGVELGDLSLEAGAAIRGRLLLPPGRSPQGWEVVLDEGLPRNRREPSADGRFQFDGLEPGVHALSLRLPDGHESGIVHEVDLPVGETVDVEIDGSALLPAELRVRVTREGRPWPGSRVQWSCGQPGRGGRDFGAPTDAEGRTGGTLPPCDALWLYATSSIGLRTGRMGSPIALLPDGSADAEIEVTAGEVTLRFPSGFVIPPKGQAYVSVRSTGEPNPDFQMVILATRDAPYLGSRMEWTGRDVELGLMAVGEYDVEVQVNRCVPRDLDGTSQNAFDPVARFEGRIRVPGDRPVLCDLEPFKDR